MFCICLLINCVILLQFDLMLSEDGSGRGAALVAAVAVRDELLPRTNGVATK